MVYHISLYIWFRKEIKESVKFSLEICTVLLVD